MTGNSSGREVVIVGVGAASPLGMTAAATAAAARAGSAGFGEHPFLVDTAGNKFVIARVPQCGVEIKGSERLATLSRTAATEALSPLLERRAKLSSLSVIVGLPPARPGRPQDAENALTEYLRADLQALAQALTIDTISTGHASGVMALEAGWRKIRQGTTDFCLIGGIDSYLELETLLWLEKQEQIHGAGKLNNAWGFVPGEAAAWCLLAARAAAQKWHLPFGLRILTAGTTQETKLIKTPAVCTGEGLIALFRQLAPALPVGARFAQVLCDLNGEPYRADEYGFATMRTGSSFVDAADFVAPADCWGDIGAASGPAFVVLADAATRKGYARDGHWLLWTSSESGERSGAVLQAAQ